MFGSIVRHIAVILDKREISFFGIIIILNNNK